MLRLILGTDWTANRDRILAEISEDVKKGQGGRILMVPELISHDTERRLAAAAGDSASRFAEVLSFTRLARRVAESMGSGAEECLDNGGRVVAMAAAARQLHSRLKAYGGVETRPEFLTGLVDAVDEFKRCCISSRDLLKAARQTQGSLAQKLEELSLLLESYDALCARGKGDPRDQMTWLLEQLEEGSFGESHVFYIDGFPDFTRQHLAILEHLIRVSPRVTVSLNCDAVDSKQMAFEKAGQTASELVRCARRGGVPVEITVIPGDGGPLQPVRAGLFQGKIQPVPGLKERLRLYRRDSGYQECVAAAEHILALVRGGCRYRDIGLVCGNMAAYDSVLQLVFHQCGIPLYRSGTEDVLCRPVIAALLGAMEAALGGLEQREVLRYLRSVLSPLDPDDCDRLENYAILWGITGSRWQQPFGNHPDGLGGEWDEAAEEALAALNRDRERAMAPLLGLREGFRQARRLSQQVEAVYGFLEELDLARRLDNLARELDEAGDNPAAQVLNQLWEILLTALEQLYDVLGETVWDGEVFTRLFTLLLSQYDVGTIPPVLDGVTAGPVSAMRCQQVKHLVVLGALEGALPGYGGARGVLTDQERVTLRELGVPLTGGAMEGIQAEFAEIYGVFCGAGETITVSCPGGQPSYLYRRLAELAGGETVLPPAMGAALAGKDQAGRYLARWDAEEAASCLGAEESFRETCRRRAYTLGRISGSQVRKLYGKELRLSASQADRQAQCRLSYFLEYGLRARERKPAEIDPAEFGTYVHAVLEQTARRVMELGGFHQVSQEDTLALALEFAGEYARERFSQMDSSRLRYLFQRNNQELEMVVRELWQELSHSEFAPVGFEVGFEEGKDLPTIPIPGGKIPARLRGYVDRVDVWQGPGSRYFRVVDYKTGQKDIDYCDLLNGVGLQMLLYLFALEQEGEPVLGGKAYPAGVQYFPARAPLLNADGALNEEEAEKLRAAKWKRNGLLLRDEAVLSAMEPEGSPPRLCCAVRKDGTLTGDLADREELKKLKAYIFRVLGEMVDDIASGKVDPNPYTRGSSHDACGLCPYGPVCNGGKVPGRRNFKAVRPQEFWEQIEKEENRHG